MRDLLSLSQEFIAVRVQDPRVQNEGSWNSFVDYKIFLHVSINTKIKTRQVNIRLQEPLLFRFQEHTTGRAFVSRQIPDVSALPGSNRTSVMLCQQQCSDPERTDS